MYLCGVYVKVVCLGKDGGGEERRADEESRMHLELKKKFPLIKEKRWNESEYENLQM